MQNPTVPQYLIKEIVAKAFAEDLGLAGDITTNSIITKQQKGKAYIIANQNGILAGLPIAYEVLRFIDTEIEFSPDKKEGERIKKGEIIARLTGSLQSIIIAERIMLNFLAHLSAIASLTNDYVQAVAHSSTGICCTRKTIPGIRALQKYAVNIGGGINHRFGLYDGILIKDNHIAAAGSIKKAIDMAKKHRNHMNMLEVEVESIEQLHQALAQDIDCVMLDNMDMENIKIAVRICKNRVKTEVSGNIDLQKATLIARTGVDLISVGRLTHSVNCLDLSLELQS